MIILLGASASGKTEVCKKLCNNFGMKKVVTYTSRAPRVGEVDGVDYNFLSKDEFEKRLNEGFFFEHVCFNGNYYGTSVASLTTNSVLIVEPNGFKAYRESGLKHIVSFYLDSTEDKRRAWMEKRGDAPELIEKRLLNDREAFKLDNIEGINYVLDSNNQSIELMMSEIHEIYIQTLKSRGLLNE